MTYLNPFPRNTRKSQLYGSNPNNGVNPPGGHNGDDYAVQVGTPVRAAGNGTVVFAGEFDSTYADNFGWNLNFGGLMVVLNLDGETAPYVEYGHNDKLLVKTGERVVRGQIIAESGNSDGGTGVSTGPHCHVGVLPWNFDLGSPTYGRINPAHVLTDYWEDEEDMGLTKEQSDALAYIASPKFKVDIFAGGTEAECNARAAFRGELLNHGVQVGDTDQTTSLALFLRWYGSGLDNVYRAALDKGDKSPGEVARMIVDELGDDVARAVADEVGRRLSA